MPEMVLTCGNTEYFRPSITVENYCKYMNIMERGEDAGALSAMRTNNRVLQSVFGISSGVLYEAEAVEALKAVQKIHFFINEITARKFLDLGPHNPVEIEKSAFDDYDRENGYEDEKPALSVWAVNLENIKRVIHLCVRAFHDSYTATMAADIIDLLDFIKFEVDHKDDK